MKTKKLTICAMVIALHVAIMIITQSFAFGPIQIRIATMLYALAWFYPELIIPFGLSNILCNLLLGGFGPLDAVGGFIIGSVTTAMIVLLQRKKAKSWTAAIPIILIPGLGVPVYLSFLLGTSYVPLAISLCLGQVLPAVAGVILIKAIESRNILRN